MFEIISKKSISKNRSMNHCVLRSGLEGKCFCADSVELDVVWSIPSAADAIGDDTWHPRGAKIWRLHALSGVRFEHRAKFLFQVGMEMRLTFEEPLVPAAGWSICAT